MGSIGTGFKVYIGLIADFRGEPEEVIRNGVGRTIKNIIVRHLLESGAGRKIFICTLRK